MKILTTYNICQYYKYGDDWLQFVGFVAEQNWKEEVTNYLSKEYHCNWKSNNEDLIIGQKYIIIIDTGKAHFPKFEFIEMNEFLNKIEEQYRKAINMFNNSIKELV